VRVLVVNAGSSSVKLRVVDDDDAVLGVADLSATAGRFEPGELQDALGELGDVDAAGHRVVHGGTRFTEPVRLDDEVIGALGELSALAPLHQPFSLAAIAATTEALPGVPGVACFDTAFHATLPPEASTYAVPPAWREHWRVRRYGFHGLSHAWASRRAAELCDRAGDPGFRVVTCHLGAGASLAAVHGGRSIDTTMGFTPLEGLVMATRSGTIDPGLALWLIEHGGLDVAEVSDGLEHRGGLTGLAGTGDLREVLAAADRGDAAARLAIDVYIHSLCAHVAAMAASLGGLDALVFTGGVGEHAGAIRVAAAERLSFLGIAVGDDRDAGASGAAEITAGGAPVRTFVVTAREDAEIARGVRSVLA
jgi:acetate kinase